MISRVLAPASDCEPKLTFRAITVGRSSRSERLLSADTLRARPAKAGFQTLLSARSPRGVGFYGVVAGNHFQRDEIGAFALTYNLAFPVLPDVDFALADFLGAMTTAEAFVVTAGGESLYKGAIDNWAFELGQRRQVITEHYLRDVLDELLSGRDIPYRETRAIGCFIERES